MKASAPGKLVISGAYAVLRGAPCIVTAVNRRVIADTARPAEFEAAEVLALFSLVPELRSVVPALRSVVPSANNAVPHIDASALRHAGQKLGLGSSAAITVASLAALCPTMPAAELLSYARKAHRLAQGGGSGTDIVSATLGRTQRVELRGEELLIEEVELPKTLCVEVWALPSPATTSDFVRRVFHLEASNAAVFSTPFSRQMLAANAAADALQSKNATAFIEAINKQYLALLALGEAASVPIITSEMSELAAMKPAGSAILPAGAGGGDIVLLVGEVPSDQAFRAKAHSLGLHLLEIELGAPGVARIPE